MKQLIQNFKTGNLYIDELPIPAVNIGMVLVENRFSLISAGTERSTVDVGKASLIGKALKRPDLVKQVIQNYKKEGLKATISKVTTKLDSLKALGYSSAGVVAASMDTNAIYKPGDRVACAGQDYASHAGFVSIPQNLVARIPDNVSFEEASFTTLGAIALQGVRQANPTLGESVCVIGLGLLGQLTCQLLKANGCRVFGIDISPAMVNLTNSMGYAEALQRNDTSLMTAAVNFAKGNGFDKVIITAAAPTNDPIVLATELLRRKGVIILVGAVQMEIPREPFFYKKELEFKISCSYGPGRYDAVYEEEGHDYPIGYVRWTEQRNMQAFLDLIGSGALNIKPLITHVFSIEDGEKAYDIVLGKVQEPFIGILLKYEYQERKSEVVLLASDRGPKQSIKAGFIGAGSFAQSYLIPNASKLATLGAVVTRNGITGKNVAEKFGFASSSTSADDVINDMSTDVVFIATQHDTHARYTLAGLKAGKCVFVEKPLALSYEELAEIKEAYGQHPHLVMVGFNRRFADICVKAQAVFAKIGEPITMNFRVNAGFIPKDHWTQRSEGGGRILGEVCHFVDLMQFLTDAKPVKVYAECIATDASHIQAADNISVVIRFSDGSVGNLLYTANGDKGFAKERFEIFGGNQVFIIDDFRSGSHFKDGKEIKFKNEGKGHRQEIAAFLKSVKDGEPSPISFESLLLTTLTTLKIIDSLQTGLPQKISTDDVPAGN